MRSDLTRTETFPSSNSQMLNPSDATLVSRLDRTPQICSPLGVSLHTASEGSPFKRRCRCQEEEEEEAGSSSLRVEVRGHAVRIFQAAKLEYSMYSYLAQISRSAWLRWGGAPSPITHGTSTTRLPATYWTVRAEWQGSTPSLDPDLDLSLCILYLPERTCNSSALATVFLGLCVPRDEVGNRACRPRRHRAYLCQPDGITLQQFKFWMSSSGPLSTSRICAIRSLFYYSFSSLGRPTSVCTRTRIHSHSTLTLTHRSTVIHVDQSKSPYVSSSCEHLDTSHHTTPQHTDR